MLDLQRYKKRLEHGHYAQSYIAAEDVADLVAEVERMRDDNHALQAEVILTIEQMERLREAIAKHRAEHLTGNIPARDRELWEALHA